jgi:hypothetical protein
MKNSAKSWVVNNMDSSWLILISLGVFTIYLAVGSYMQMVRNAEDRRKHITEQLKTQRLAERMSAQEIRWAAQSVKADNLIKFLQEDHQKTVEEAKQLQKERTIVRV